MRSSPSKARVKARVIQALCTVLALICSGAPVDAQGLQAPPTVLLPTAGARVVPRLLLQSDAVVFSHGPAAPALADAESREGLYLRRARLGAEVSAGLWRGRLLFEAASQSETVSDSVATGGPPSAANNLDPIAGELAGAAPRATEAFIALAPHKAFTVAAGSLRVPIGLSRQTDEGDLRLPERPRVVTRTTPDYRVGIAASGDLGLLQYAFGAYAAASRLAATASNFAEGGALYLVRLSAEPLGPLGLAPQLRRRADPWYDWWRFSLGVSAFHARLPGDDESGLGGDAQFQWRRLCVIGELLWTRRRSADRVGFAIEPGLFVIPDRLEVVTRLEWFNDQVGPRTPVDGWGASAGATLFSVTRLMRGQLAYTWRRTPGSGERASGWVLLRATFTL